MDSRMMECDQQSGRTDQQQGVTLLEKQLGVQHTCDHRCHVVPLFGNAFRCEHSGQVHICDANCSQRVYRDRWSSVCRVSKRIFTEPAPALLPDRKRVSTDSSPSRCKRGPGAPALCGAGAGAFCAASDDAPMWSSV